MYPPPHMCSVCNESFVLEVELVRHRKFGCATERMKERLLEHQDREQRRLQVWTQGCVGGCGWVWEGVGESGREWAYGCAWVVYCGV